MNKPNFLGYTGYANCGKSEVINKVLNEEGYIVLSTSAYMQESLTYFMNRMCNITGFTPEWLQNKQASFVMMLEAEEKHTNYKIWRGEWDRRQFLVNFAESFRDMFGRDFWVKQVFAEAEEYLDQGEIVAIEFFNREEFYLGLKTANVAPETFSVDAPFRDLNDARNLLDGPNYFNQSVDTIEQARCDFKRFLRQEIYNA